MTKTGEKTTEHQLLKDRLIQLFTFEKPYFLSFNYRQKISEYKTYKPLLDELVSEGKAKLISDGAKTKTYQYIGPDPKVIASNPEPSKKSENNITFKAEPIAIFYTFSNWVNHASTELGGYPRDQKIVCIDKAGNCCASGLDFMVARDNDLFPVTGYRLIRTSELHQQKDKA